MPGKSDFDLVVLGLSTSATIWYRQNQYSPEVLFFAHPRIYSLVQTEIKGMDAFSQP